MKTFEEFCDYLKENIAGYIKNLEIQDVRLIQVSKPGRVLTSLNIISADCNVSPNFYLDPLYEEYKKDTSSLTDIVIKIANHPCWNDRWSFANIERLMSFDACKDRIVYRFMSRNDIYLEYLNSRLWHPYGNSMSDIAMVFDIDITDKSSAENEGTAQIPITPQLVYKWNKCGEEVTIDDIVAIAKENTERIRPAEIIDLRQIFDELVDEGIKIEKDTDYLKPEIVAVTNVHRQFGAPAITYPKVIDKVRQTLQCDDVYILPSSVHELICVPQECASIKELLEMNNSVNEEQVEEDDFLANDVYVLRDGVLISVSDDLKYGREYYTGEPSYEYEEEIFK